MAEARQNLDHIVFNIDVTDVFQWSKVWRSIYRFHSVLCCVVCFELCIMPVSLPDQNCRHACCAKCLEKRLKMHFPCPSCSDFRGAILNDKLRRLLFAHKHLCAVLLQSGFIRHYTGAWCDCVRFKAFVKVLNIGATYGNAKHIFPDHSTDVTPSSSASVDGSGPNNPSIVQVQPDPFRFLDIPKVSLVVSGTDILAGFKPPF